MNIINASQTESLRFLLEGALLFALALTASSAEPAAASKPEEKAPMEKKDEEPATYNNWFDVTVAGTLIDGDKAQFKQRRQLPKGAFGGIEDFHYEQEVAKDTLMKIDGHGLFDNHDYSLKFELVNPEKGYLRAGYREFRTYYDGSGGFFPATGQWISGLYDEEFELDRGEAFFQAGLTLPDKPLLTLEYRYQFRNGRKASTSWGDNTQTGPTRRGIVPAFWDIDENRHLLAANVTHTLGKSDLGLGLRYEWSDHDNSRNIRRAPGLPQDRFVTQREDLQTDLFNVHASSQTRLHDKILFTSGYSFTTLDSDLAGRRIYGADYDLPFDPTFRGQLFDEGFTDLTGGSRLFQHIANLNLMLTPWENLTLVPALRVEARDLEGFSSATDLIYGAAPATPDPLLILSDRDLLDVSESIEARFTGFTNWVLYASGFWLEGDGDLSEREFDAANALNLSRNTDDTRFTQKYTAGANWYPRSRLSFGAQYYHKIRETDYATDPATWVPGSFLYPGFLTAQDFETDDVNFRVTVRPFSRLTSVSRYDFQLSTVDTTGRGLATVESAEITSHILSQSFTWNLLARLYLQGTITYVMDQLDTPADEITPAVTKTKNDYWNATAGTGLALSDKSDLQTQYFYYRADNYDPESASIPYGAGAEEHGVTTGLIHRFKPSLRWTLKYGFFSARDQTSGGHNNYQAHLVYSSWQYRF